MLLGGLFAPAYLRSSPLTNPRHMADRPVVRQKSCGGQSETDWSAAPGSFGLSACALVCRSRSSLSSYWLWADGVRSGEAPCHAGSARAFRRTLLPLIAVVPMIANS
jgi:hypothetical protein